MRTLGEHNGIENPTETSLHQEEIKEQVDSLLQIFDVLPPRFDRVIFKYIYVYMLGLFFLFILLFILITLLLGNNPLFQIGRGFLEAGAYGVLVIVAMILVIWPFNVWRASTPKMLRDIFEKKRVYIPGNDATLSYLRFLENYQKALASRKRYLVSGILVLMFGFFYAYGIFQFYRLFFSTAQPNIVVATLVVIVHLLYPLVILGAVYCLGILFWTMFISGWYVRKLMRVFELSIQPRHPDQCGGLKLLGNFCFGLAFPIFTGTGLVVGQIVYSLKVGGDEVFFAQNIGVPLLSLLLYGLPAAIFAFFLPLKDIHRKMVSEGEADDDTYSARIEALEKQIQNLLDTNQIEEAKAMHEKKALMETLHAPYPTWPFSFRSKFFSTVLGVSGSLLIGLITAAVEQYFFPAILPLLFHKP